MQEPADREAVLLLRAGDLVMEGGLPSLTLRSLAQAAGVSPSLVTYRFGSRDVLVRRMFEAARARDTLFWQRMQDEAEGLDLHAEALAGVMAGLVLTATTAGARDQILGWVCGSEAVRAPDLKDVSEGWSGQGVCFWRSVLSRSGQDGDLAPALTACMLWVIRVGLTAQGGELLTQAWVMDLTARLHARLFGPGVASARDSAARQKIEARAQSRPAAPDGALKQTPQRIIDAAARLAAAGGPDALTHRLIAKEAGVSLSSMTHHFASLDEIQRYAFDKLYEDARKAAVPELSAHISIEHFTHSILPDVFARADAQGHSGIAMDEIILSASRTSRTEALGSGLMALVGQSSTAMLKAMAGDVTIDRLDGQIFRFVMTGLNEQAALQPDDARKDWFAENCARFLRAYLGQAQA